jgi:hypothetical protein
MFSLDHLSGYHHVPIVKSSRKYLGFRWEGKYYQYCALPFGWAPACCIYDSLSAVLAAFLRQLLVHVIAYLDDFGIAVPSSYSKGRAYMVLWLVWAVMYLAGYTLSEKKSMRDLAHTMVLLGFGIDSIGQRYYVPADKLAALLELLEAVLGAQAIPIWDLQSLLGKAQSMSLAIPPVSIFLKSSFALLRHADADGRRLIYLPEQARTDLAALRRLREWEGLSRWPTERHRRMRMDTDASGDGWGAVLFRVNDSVTAAGRFGPADSGYRIHIKEMMAVRRGLDQLGDDIHDCYLDLYTDNTVVEASLSKGSSIVPELQQFAKELLDFQLRRNVIVKVHRVTTGDNAVADELSRGTYGLQSTGYDRNDHMLSPAHFRLLQSWFPLPFSIDACAGPRNTQVPRFISRQSCPHPGCVAVNVLAYPFPKWNHVREFVYCNPPWPLISPVWRHFRLSHVRGVLIVPDHPHEQWYAPVLRDAISVRRLASAGDADVFRQPSTSYLFSVGPVRWNVLAVQFDF